MRTLAILLLLAGTASAQQQHVDRCIGLAGSSQITCIEAAMQQWRLELETKAASKYQACMDWSYDPRWQAQCEKHRKDGEKWPY